ncbi:MAG: DUF1573 domain-containing protein [Chloroflexota bacterium]|jgi:hypothetical protein
MTRITQTRRRSGRVAGNQKELLIALILIGGAALLLVMAVMIARQPASATLSAANESEIVTGNRITAIHTMGSSPRIPFLPQGDPQPKIAVPEKFFDFGRIGAQDIVSHTFLVRNSGEAPLTISHAYTTCGCTTAEISADVIPPGKAVTVDLRFDAGFHDSAGQTVRRGIILESNDPDQPLAEIWVQADVASR